MFNGIRDQPQAMASQPLWLIFGFRCRPRPPHWLQCIAAGSPWKELLHGSGCCLVSGRAWNILEPQWHRHNIAVPWWWDPIISKQECCVGNTMPQIRMYATSAFSPLAICQIELFMDTNGMFVCMGLFVEIVRASTTTTPAIQ